MNITLTDNTTQVLVVDTLTINRFTQINNTITPDNLKSFEIDSGNLTTIPDSGFENCTNLISVTIGSSITNIGNNAFKKTNIGKIIFKGTIRTISMNTSVFNEPRFYNALDLPEDNLSNNNIFQTLYSQIIDNNSLVVTENDRVFQHLPHSFVMKPVEPETTNRKRIMVANRDLNILSTKVNIDEQRAVTGDLTNFLGKVNDNSFTLQNIVYIYFGTNIHRISDGFYKNNRINGVLQKVTFADDPTQTNPVDLAIGIESFMSAFNSSGVLGNGSDSDLIIISIEIPSRVTEVGSFSFNEDNTGGVPDLLESLIFSESIPNRNNYSFIARHRSFSGCRFDNQKITIPQRTILIESFVFVNNLGIIEIAFENENNRGGLAPLQLHDNAFVDSVELTSDLLIPSYVTSIGAAAFANITKVANVIFKRNETGNVDLDILNFTGNGTPFTNVGLQLQNDPSVIGGSVSTPILIGNLNNNNSINRQSGDVIFS